MGFPLNYDGLLGNPSPIAKSQTGDQIHIDAAGQGGGILREPGIHEENGQDQ